MPLEHVLVSQVMKSIHSVDGPAKIALPQGLLAIARDTGSLSRAFKLRRLLSSAKTNPLGKIRQDDALRLYVYLRLSGVEC